MKQKISSIDSVSVAILTNKPEYKNLVEKTLAHVYPRVDVIVSPAGSQFQASDSTILILDTGAISGASLEHTLDTHSNNPTILVVKDIAETRFFGNLLSTKRSIVHQSDLSGMGLLGAVHHLRERLKLHEQLQKTSKHLKELSVKDELTHLFNHGYFDDILTAEVKKANRYKRPVGLVLLSIKDFGTINEHFGHDEGDRILAKAGELIQTSVREVDIPARFGDNEFGIILPESDENAAKIVATRINGAFSNITVTRKMETSGISLAIGIASIGSKIHTKEDLLKRALSALSLAKKDKNHPICTSSDMAIKGREVKENHRLAEHLKEKLAQIADNTEKNYFQAVIKLFEEVPHARKLLHSHSERVAFFAERLALHLGMESAAVKSIYRAGFLHDAGKLVIDSSILLKADKLSFSEIELVRQHPIFAANMLGNPAFFTIETDAIFHHHERIDGKGYPQGLSGEAIPVAARILAIAEAWDTMITPQPYRTEPLGLDLALAELKAGAGTQFDADLVEKFAYLIAG